MARKPRVEFAGTFYHVIARGNQRAVTPAHPPGMDLRHDIGIPGAYRLHHPLGQAGCAAGKFDSVD